MSTAMENNGKLSGQMEMGYPGPITPGERIASIDILRGVAVMGILAMNIFSFALPFSAYLNPFVGGGTEPLNMAAWRFTNLFFNMKFMTIFSMLFGAGLIIMYQRAQESGSRLKPVYYRRLLWLMFFGLVHSFFLWWGDILFLYGACGLLLYLFRKAKIKTLIITGLAVLSFGAALMSISGYFFGYIEREEQRIEEMQAEGKTLDHSDIKLQETWHSIHDQFEPSPGQLRKEIDIHKGGYIGILKYRDDFVVMMQTQGVLFSGLWRAGGMMLLGMALFRLGVFSAGRSKRFYLLMMLAGYAIGLPIVWYGGEKLLAHHYDFIYKFQAGNIYNYYASLFVALGHISAVMLFANSGILPWLKTSLGAVGRMALTNYLMQTIVMTTIFYGYGFGLFGDFGRFQLTGFVAGMWIVQMIYSPIWLHHFRFGPFEWLWRTLTYKKFQPMRIKSADRASAV